jgi:uncharacterized spore protein YtfJ
MKVAVGFASNTAEFSNSPDTKSPQEPETSDCWGPGFAGGAGIGAKLALD